MFARFCRNLHNFLLLSKNFRETELRTHFKINLLRSIKKREAVTRHREAVTLIACNYLLLIAFYNWNC